MPLRSAGAGEGARRRTGPAAAAGHAAQDLAWPLATLMLGRAPAVPQPPALAQGSHPQSCCGGGRAPPFSLWVSAYGAHARTARLKLLPVMPGVGTFLRTFLGLLQDFSWTDPRLFSVCSRTSSLPPSLLALAEHRSRHSWVGRHAQEAAHDSKRVLERVCHARRSQHGSEDAVARPRAPPTCRVLPACARAAPGPACRGYSTPALQWRTPSPATLNRRRGARLSGDSESLRPC